MDGYLTIYENVGKYAGVTDRCHNGGTIINYKVPQTGDSDWVSVNYILFVMSAMCLGFWLVRWTKVRRKA